MGSVEGDDQGSSPDISYQPEFVVEHMQVSLTTNSDSCQNYDSTTSMPVYFRYVGLAVSDAFSLQSIRHRESFSSVIPDSSLNTTEAHSYLFKETCSLGPQKRALFCRRFSGTDTSN